MIVCERAAPKSLDYRLSRNILLLLFHPLPFSIEVFFSLVPVDRQSYSSIQARDDMAGAEKTPEQGAPPRVKGEATHYHGQGVAAGRRSRMQETVVIGKMRPSMVVRRFEWEF
ncbi:hypothetical protein L7F22_060739 [Adiantum nelumboides]|nr:hypothetical protein [Adiantum nelumboides]